MKKFVSLLLAGAIGLSGLIGLAACGDTTDSGKLAEVVKEGQSMTTAQLLEKAKTETGSFIAYGNTSRITTAMTNFVAAYPELGLTESTGAAQKMGDSAIYTTLTTEAMAANNSKNASVVLIQDSASLSLYRDNTSYLTNYVSDEFKSNVDSDNLVPLAHQFINKLFMYNTAGSTNAKFTNVWQLTESSYKGKIYFKSPANEQVNMNFLIMLTNDSWSKKLETAYTSYKGSAATDVGESKTYTNYGYKWIAEFLANCNFSINSDTTIAEDLSKDTNAGNMGLFVLSKLRSSSVNSDNLQVSAWDKDSSDNYVTIEPFAGFMYSIYAQLVTNGPRPYTGMLFINYLMTAEGFKPWASMGGYSSNKSIAVTEGDSELSFWKDRLVVEDGSYIASVKGTVQDWITTKLPS